MSLFVLDLDRLRHAEHGMDNIPEWSDMWGDKVRWRVCPECLWLTLSYDPNLLCRRTATDPVAYGGWFEVFGTSTLCMGVKVALVPEALADTLWSALRLGGVNAVVEITCTLRPEDMGLLSSVAKAKERRDRLPPR